MKHVNIIFVAVIVLCVLLLISSGCKTTVGKDPLTGLYILSFGINIEEAKAATDIGTSVAQSITALEVERNKAEAEIESAKTEAERQAAKERRDAIQAAIDKLVPAKNDGIVETSELTISGASTAVSK